MTESNKKVNNPLFSVSVTGSTFEDFSQNAILLPAKEKTPPPPPVLNVSQDRGAENFFETLAASAEPFHNQHPQQAQGIFYPPQSNFDTSTQQVDLQSQPQQQRGIFFPPHPIFEAPTQQIDLQPQPQQSNLSSVFSSFSNILKLGGSPQNVPPAEDIIVSPPAGIETLIGQDPTNVQPVPLFVPTEGLPLTNTPSPKPPQGPVNTFRRSGLKRPVYAQVPGLSSSGQPQPPQTYSQPLPPPPTIQQPQPLPPLQPNFVPQSTASSFLPEFTPTNNISLPLSEFKPIAPQPSSFLSSVDSVPIFTPTASSHFQHQSSPLMASEILQSPNLAAMSNNNLNGENAPTVDSSNRIYRPVYNHWFHKRETEGKQIWQPFSMVDSLSLDQAFVSNDLDPDKVVPTDGGRFDVNILRRQRIPVYWKGTPNEVRRCSWFHKGNSDGRYVPYDENIATKLEEEFKTAFESNQWHRKVELPNGETVVFHDPDVLVLFPPTQSPDNWGNTQSQMRPRVVKRGMDEFDIDEGEPAHVDHLLFLVHGIGSVCDLKFRTVEEVVDEFRSISLQLVQSHYKSSCERGIANRVEVLPISWHDKLHSDDTGIDKKLKGITLESIPKLRDFTNDTILDVLFYTSPVYCQTIVSTVGTQMNNIFELFKMRNPEFKGGVSLGGHSLGSLILFDLLCHQHPEPEPEQKSPDLGDEDVIAPLGESKKPPPAQRRMSRRISYMMGTVGTGQPQIQYPHLIFEPKAFFALGSPIGMFVTVRGLDNLGEHFALPTCPAFFNIFHPYDPVAYRIESLINPDLATLKPVLIPHHKGRKRMHLELKETMARVGADLKQKVMDSMKSTWNSFYQLAMFHRQTPPNLEEEVAKAISEQMQEREDQSADEEPEQQPTDLSLGILNKNRRIDYVLQEAPFEFFNEYIFALTSHVCYWESEDTMLLMLKEIYGEMNVTPDDKIPQQTMTIERPPPSPKSRTPTNSQSQSGSDPTRPIQARTNLGPPPVAGFIKKT